MKTLMDMVELVAKEDRVISILLSEVDSRLGKLSQAARGYIKEAASHHMLSDKITVAEHKRLIGWCEKVRPSFKASDQNGQNSYYVYPDGSLFLSCTAENEVWDSVSDRADEIAQFWSPSIAWMKSCLSTWVGRYTA